MMATLLEALPPDPFAVPLVIPIARLIGVPIVMTLLLVVLQIEPRRNHIVRDTRLIDLVQIADFAIELFEYIVQLIILFS